MYPVGGGDATSWCQPPQPKESVTAHVKGTSHIWSWLPVTARPWCCACGARGGGAPCLPRGSQRRIGRAVFPRAFLSDSGTSAPRRLLTSPAWSTRCVTLSATCLLACQLATDASWQVVTSTLTLCDSYGMDTNMADMNKWENIIIRVSSGL